MSGPPAATIASRAGQAVEGHRERLSKAAPKSATHTGEANRLEGPQSPNKTAAGLASVANGPPTMVTSELAHPP
jgi:hypothetical protein